MNLIINESIPGWTSRIKLETLAKLASEVPEGGWIVEIGSYVGRSSYALGMNKKDSVLLTCIDPWPTEKFNQVPLRTTLYGTDHEQMHYSIEQWKKNTQGIKNVETIRMWMPLDVNSSLIFKKKAHLLFIDGGHTYEETHQNLHDWVMHRMAPGGKVIIDDYRDSDWPCVTNAVDDFVNQYPSIKFDRLQDGENYCMLSRP